MSKYMLDYYNIVIVYITIPFQIKKYTFTSTILLTIKKKSSWNL